MRRLAVIALPLLLAACQGETRTTVSTETTVNGETVSQVSADQPWCRPTPQGRDVTACYLILTSTTGDRVISVLSPRASRSELHSVSMENGMMTMQEMPNGLDLPAGQTVSLAPGGDHIMLLGVTVPLAEGDFVPLALTFQSGDQIALEAIVRAAPVEEASGGNAG